MTKEKELIVVSQNIKDIIGEIGKYRREIEDKGRARAKAISDYDKRMRIAIVTLKDEGKFPATLIEKIAKGICAPEIEAREIAESNYKAVISNLQALMAQLNAHQSLFRHLEEA